MTPKPPCHQEGSPHKSQWPCWTVSSSCRDSGESDLSTPGSGSGRVRKPADLLSGSSTVSAMGRRLREPLDTKVWGSYLPCSQSSFSVWLTPTLTPHAQPCVADRQPWKVIVDPQLLPACFSFGPTSECLAQGQTWCAGTNQELKGMFASPTHVSDSKSIILWGYRLFQVMLFSTETPSV